MIISEYKRREYEQILKENKIALEKLQDEQRAAAAFGDLSENEEYHAVTASIHQLINKNAEIENILAESEVEEDDNSPNLVVGSFIEVTNVTDNREPRIFRLDVGGDTLNENPMRRVLGIDSPLGKLILNGVSGTYNLASRVGNIEYKIVKLSKDEVAKLSESHEE